jgi:hypothetical protein
VRGQRREGRHPGADFVGGVAGLLLDPGVRPAVHLVEAIRVDQLEEPLIPFGIERL